MIAEALVAVEALVAAGLLVPVSDDHDRWRGCAERGRYEGEE